MYTSRRSRCCRSVAAGVHIKRRLLAGRGVRCTGANNRRAMTRSLFTCGFLQDLSYLSVPSSAGSCCTLQRRRLKVGLFHHETHRVTLSGYEWQKRQHRLTRGPPSMLIHIELGRLGLHARIVITSSELHRVYLSRARNARACVSLSQLKPP